MRIISKITIMIAVLLITAHAAAKAGRGKAVMPVDPESFKFVVISDCRSGDRVYAQIVDQLVKRDPDFVVFVGDILPTLKNEEQWNNFQKLSEPVNVPFYLAPGNHDIEDRSSEAFWRSHVDLPGRETYYKFTAGKNLFVILNSNEPGNISRISGAQFDWLKNTLDPDSYEHQFVFVHHPLFLWKGAFHEGESLDRYPKDRDRLHKLFVDKKVDMVFHGHEHTYRRMDMDGVRYIITGGAGSPLYNGASNFKKGADGVRQTLPGGPGSERHRGFNHFTLVSVDGSVIKTKVIDRKGMMRDQFMMFKKLNSE